MTTRYSTEQFAEQLRSLLQSAPVDLPHQIVTVLQQVEAWLDDGPCEHCDGYHDSGSC